MATILASTPCVSAATVRASFPKPPASSNVRATPSIFSKSISRRTALKAANKDIVEGVKENLTGLKDSIVDTADNVADGNWPAEGKRNADSAARDVKRGADSAARDVKRRTEDAGQAGQDGLADLKGKVENAADSVGGKIQDAVDNLKKAVRGDDALWGTGALRMGVAALLAVGVFLAPAPNSMASILGDVQESVKQAGDSIKDTAASVGESGPLVSIEEGIKEAKAEGVKGAGSLRDWSGKQPQTQYTPEESVSYDASGVGEAVSSTKEQAADFVKSKASNVEDVIKGGLSSTEVNNYLSDKAKDLAGSGDSLRQGVKDAAGEVQRNVGEPKDFFKGVQDAFKGVEADKDANLAKGANALSSATDTVKGKAYEADGAVKGALSK